MESRTFLFMLVALFGGLVGGFLLGWSVGRPDKNQMLDDAWKDLQDRQRAASRAAEDASASIAANKRRRDQLGELTELLAPVTLPDGTRVEKPDQALAARLERAWQSHVARALEIQKIDAWLSDPSEPGLLARTPDELGLTAAQFDTMKAALEAR